MEQNNTDKNISITNQIATVNILVMNDRFNHDNGNYIPVFQKELEAVVTNPQVSGETLRVLMFMLSRVKDSNSIGVSAKEIIDSLKSCRRTVYKAINTLIAMQLICQKQSGHNSMFCLSDKIINPRIAFKGNTNRMNKYMIPPILSPDGKTPLIKNDFEYLADSLIADEQEPQK